MRRHSSACHSACSAQVCTSPTDSASGLPWSSVMLWPIASARSRASALAWCHNFWLLKSDSGATIAELHGLAYDRIHHKILPIGSTQHHALRVFLFPHDAAYAEEVGRALHTTRMYGKSRAQVAYRGEDSLARWAAAVNAMPLLDALDLTYPPFGFYLRT